MIKKFKKIIINYIELLRSVFFLILVEVISHIFDNFILSILIKNFDAQFGVGLGEVGELFGGILGTWGTWVGRLVGWVSDKVWPHFWSILHDQVGKLSISGSQNSSAPTSPKSLANSQKTILEQNLQSNKRTWHFFLDQWSINKPR